LRDSYGNDSSRHRLGHTFEEVVTPALLRPVPIGIVVGVFGNEALGVRHEAEHAAGIVLEAGDLGAGAIDVLAIKQGGVAVLDVFFGIAGFTDEAAFSMGHGQFEVVRQGFEEGAGVAVLFQRRPAADETATGVVDQAATWQKIELREDLEAVADAQDITAIGHELLQALTQLVLGDELGDATAHDVIAIAEATGENDELSAIQRCRLQQGHGQDFRAEPGGLKRAGGFQVAVGAGEFDEEGVGHGRYKLLYGISPTECNKASASFPCLESQVLLHTGVSRLSRQIFFREMTGDPSLSQFFAESRP